MPAAPRRSIGWIVLLAALWSAPAFAQGVGGTTSLNGVVVDAQGSVVPGATIEVKNTATGVTETVVSNTAGAFSIPALSPGLYVVTVSLSGFKTLVITDLRLVAATPAQIKPLLEMGALSETVEVKGGAGLVQMSSAKVQSSMLAEQITKLPLSSRNGLSSTMFLPGVQQTGASGYRGATINGLPQNTISLTLDGIGIGNNRQSGDGFYTQVFPRLDAIEEVTVTGATPDAAGGAQGSVQVAFVTRSGTNKFNTSVYDYYRSPTLNTNYYFNEINNLPVNNVTVHQFGGRIGGPIVRNKAFFFFNYEQFYLPNESTRTRTAINATAQQGLFRYDVAGQVREVNVLDLARANNQLSSVDPIVASLLAQIRTATGTTGTLTPRTDFNTDSYAYQAASQRNEYAPTARVDVNVTAKHRVSATYLWQRIISAPDFLNSGEPAFPGFPTFTVQSSYRVTGSLALRSTFSSNMFNEFKVGFQRSPVDFYSDQQKDTFDNQGGRAVQFGFGLTNPTVGNAPNLVNTPSLNVVDSLTRLRGNHSFTFGGSFTRITNSTESWNIVPTVTLGFTEANDPAASLFATTNFPGASTAQLTNARALYALLTGRVSGVNGTSRVDATTGQYVYLGGTQQRLRQHVFGAYVQDQWRMTPGLTLNLGLRWEVALPFQPTTPTYSATTLADLCGVSGIGSGPEGRECNIFKPGLLGAPTATPQYTLYVDQTRAFKTEWHNLAPNVGVAWRPLVKDGWLRSILGDPEQATIRGGYSVSFNRERIDRFTGNYGANPGGTTAANRNVANGNLVYAGEAWPILLRESARLGPPATCPAGAVTAACVPLAPVYPIPATTANSLSMFDPNITVPFTRSWSIGIQRALTNDSAIEVMYLGNRNTNAWTSENWNERNMVENGFIDEFQRARVNLTANLAAGRGSSFAYFGPGTGTAPLPIYLAYLTGSSAATDPARYSSLFASSTWTQHLSYFNPFPLTAATNLENDATRRANALAAGQPANLFVMNPAASSANIMRSVAGSHYHAMQLQYRRRLSRGLLVNASYVFSRRTGSSLQTIHQPRFYLEDAGVPHAWKLNATYALPFGNGHRFGSSWNGITNAVLGGWELSGTGRVQIEQYATEGVKLVGMTKRDLQDAFKIRIVKSETTGVTTVYSMTQDIIDNTRKAFSVDPISATGYSALGVPTGRYIAPASDPSCIALYPGDCGAPQRILLNGPAFVRFDIRGTKRFLLPGRRVSIDVSFELMNLFDNINFNPTLNPGSGATIFQVTTAYRDTGVDVNDPGGRLGQIVWRVSW